MHKPKCPTESVPLCGTLSCGQSVLQSSQRHEKAQRGAQILLDLFCGCQGEFFYKNTVLNDLNVC